MLIFPLKKEWYDKIRSGEKRIEYREVKPYWRRRLNTALTEKEVIKLHFFRKTLKELSVPCVLRLGYTSRRMSAVITKIEVVNGKDTDLHVNNPVYAFHLADVHEMHDCLVCLRKAWCPRGDKHDVRACIAWSPE